MSMIATTGRLKIMLAAILLISFFLPMSACTQPKVQSVDHEALKLVVAKYNQLLAEGYRTLNMNPLALAATEERAAKAYFHMAALGEERKRMDARQISLSFLNIEVQSPKEAAVTTLEEWQYTHLNIDSGKVMSRNSLLYELTYFLVKKEAQWLVADISINREEAVTDESLNTSKERP